MTPIPKVSVLIPNYKHEHYLPKRIESVLNQTFTDFDLLLMDDCSPDDSRAVLEAYAAKDPRVRLMFNEQNSGSTFRQWKKGLAATQGEYIWIAESDDYADPRFLERLVAQLDADMSVGLAYCNSTIVDENDKPTGNMAAWKDKFFHTDHWEIPFRVEGTTELGNYLGVTCTINNASAVLFRREAIRQCGGVDDSFRYAGDWLMYIKLALHNKIAYLPEQLSFYRDHSQNASKAAESNSALLMERILCLGYLHRHTQDPAVKSRALKQAADEYATVIYRTLRAEWNPLLLAGYVKRIFARDAAFALKLQSQVARRIASGKNSQPVGIGAATLWA